MKCLSCGAEQDNPCWNKIEFQFAHRYIMLSCELGKGHEGNHKCWMPPFQAGDSVELQWHNDSSQTTPTRSADAPCGSSGHDKV